MSSNDNFLWGKFKNDERVIPVFRSVLFFSVIAHLYRYTNSLFNSDSLGIFRGGVDIPKQVGRGRWMQPIYLQFRGEITAPFLIGILALVYLTISIILMVKILNIRKRNSIILLCGLLCVSPTITITSAAYVLCIDLFMLSLLFSMITAYCLTIAETKYRYVIAVIFLTLSLALYQAYIGACMLVCLFWLIRRCIEEEDNKGSLKRAAVMLVVFVLSLGLYYLSFKVCNMISDASSHSYNSVASATVLSGDFHLFGMILGLYKSVIKYMVRPETFYSRIAGYVHILLLCVSAALVLLTVRTKSTGKRITVLFLLILSPLAAYFIYLLYGNTDTLLNFPLSMLYLGAVMFLELVPHDTEIKLKRSLSKVFTTLAAVLIFFGMVYSNQVYVKKMVEEKETLSLMTRVLYHMESTEGYIPGKTRVVFIGHLEYSDVIVHKLGYEDLHGRTLESEISINYYNNYRMYLNNIMGYPIDLVPSGDVWKYSSLQEVIDMPAFPYPGCTQMIDDTIVVKLSS
ncbi:MAG: glucosyltransferase domain-containing protein [Solobacterium sp.]|nr:glucosyltransferase domain-containing protein [Solobacterium sp.]